MDNITSGRIDTMIEVTYKGRTASLITERWLKTWMFDSVLKDVQAIIYEFNKYISGTDDTIPIEVKLVRLLESNQYRADKKGSFSTAEWVPKRSRGVDEILERIGWLDKCDFRDGIEDYGTIYIDGDFREFGAWHPHILLDFDINRVRCFNFTSFINKRTFCEQFNIDESSFDFEALPVYEVDDGIIWPEDTTFNYIEELRTRIKNRGGFRYNITGLSDNLLIPVPHIKEAAEFVMEHEFSSYGTLLS